MWPFSKKKLVSQQEILAMADVIAKLKSECELNKARADRYWKQLENLRKCVADSNGIALKDLYDGPRCNMPIPYRVESDESYYTIIADCDKGCTVSFTREFDTTKKNHNWVDYDSALITLRFDNVGSVYGCPTMIKSPTSGIFETVKNKLASKGDVLCKIKIIPPELKTTTIQSLERESIKAAVFAREHKKMIERETLDELIAEGKIFNVITNKEGNRMAIPQDIANAVWNRDGGRCCICGNRTNLEFDHIIPISKGGSTTFRNLQLLCKTCNTKKSNKI